VSEVDSTGDIVEKQSFLNGTRYFMIEGAASLSGAPWEWTLALTLPKETGEPVMEGDLSLVADERAWFADIASGSHAERLDEATGALITTVCLQFVRRDEADCTEEWPQAEGLLELQVDTCSFSLALAPPSGVNPP
jgi:hypothetical protein